MEIPFDGIITLFVFLIGLPALVVQFMPAEVRSIVFDKGKLIPRRLILAIASFLLVVTFSSVWTLCIEKYTWVGFSSTQTWSIVWFFTFAFLITDVSLTAFWFQNTYGRRENVINSLKDRSLREFSHRERSNVGALRQLIEIGKQSTPGSDRELILNALKEIAAVTCNRPGYRGESLAVLIDGVVGMLSINPDSEDLLNYKTAVEILEIILRARPSDEESGSLRDQHHSVRALSALGQTAISQIKIRTGIDYILVGYEEALGLAVYRHPKMLSDISQAFLEVGAIALTAGQFLFAVAAMERLIVIAEEPPGAASINNSTNRLPFEATSDMLGLAAHFWSNSEGSREYIQKRLMTITNCVGKPLTRKLLAARTHCLQTMEFSTADKLAQMAKDIKPERKSRNKNK